MPPVNGSCDSENWVVEGARRAPGQGFLLSGFRRHTPLHGKPSKLTIAVTGSTVLTAAAASGVVALWPATMASQSAATAVATSATISSQAHLDGSERLASQVLSSRAVFALRQQQTAALVAQQAAARQAALRQQAARLAARRAAAQAAADRAAQQQAQQAQQQQTQPSQVTSAPPVPTGSAQQVAMGMLGSYGWSSSQFSCLNSLWNEESGWNVYATNPSSGAYGIPQALPGSKMASAGPDWQTDAATQIRWGLTYIKSLYGSPCGAWAHEEADGWY
jgi:hypothetical protein